MLISVDVGTISDKAILLTIIIINICFNWGDVIFAGKIIMPQKSHLLILSTLDVDLVA